MSDLQLQAKVLHSFGRMYRDGGPWCVSPDELVRFYPEVFDVDPFEVRECFDDLVASNHLRRIEASASSMGSVTAWELNKINGRCSCACGCTRDPSEGHKTCWPCFAETKDRSELGHILSVLQLESAASQTHCDCGGTLVEASDGVRCAACGLLHEDAAVAP